MTPPDFDQAIDRGWRHQTPLALSVACIAVYGLVCGSLIAASVKHFELIGILVRYALLLPAVVFALRRHGRFTKADIRPARNLVPIVITLFFLVAAPVGWRVGGGFVFPDENSYQFQALNMAAGHLVAPAPPVLAESYVHLPVAVHFENQILSPSGWYSKYPVGWPAVLAFPERLHFGWLVNPILGTLLLVLIGKIAMQAFGSATVFPAIAMAALSPYLLANSVGRMSHGLAGVLVALATLLCLRGLVSGKLSRFVWMFAVIVSIFHVRPFTATVAAGVLGLGSLIGTKDRPALCGRIAAFGTLAASLAIASVLIYNWRFTGSALLSPYALFRGTSVPPEIMVTPAQLIQNLKFTWRFSSQSTILFTFPFLIPLIVYRFRMAKSNSIVPWLLLALSCSLVIAHLVQFEGSSSVIGERYWSEGYFAVVILAGDGLMMLLTQWRTDMRYIRAVAIGLTAAQCMITAGAVTRLDALSRPSREMRALAETFTVCDCVVFLGQTLTEFTGKHLNLNTPDWPSAHVFYAVDPGPSGRGQWTARLHKTRWVLLAYHPETKSAKVEGSGSL